MLSSRHLGSEQNKMVDWCGVARGLMGSFRFLQRHRKTEPSLRSPYSQKRIYPFLTQQCCCRHNFMYSLAFEGLPRQEYFWHSEPSRFDSALLMLALQMSSPLLQAGHFWRPFWGNQSLNSSLQGPEKTSISQGCGSYISDCFTAGIFGLVVMWS